MKKLLEAGGAMDSCSFAHANADSMHLVSTSDISLVKVLNTYKNLKKNIFAFFLVVDLQVASQSITPGATLKDPVSNCKITSLTQILIWTPDFDSCLSGPCTHGTCKDGVLSYKCECELGYAGEDCSIGN